MMADSLPDDVTPNLAVRSNKPRGGSRPSGNSSSFTRIGQHSSSGMTVDHAMKLHAKFSKQIMKRKSTCSKQFKSCTEMKDLRSLQTSPNKQVQTACQNDEVSIIKREMSFISCKTCLSQNETSNDIQCMTHQERTVIKCQGAKEDKSSPPMKQIVLVASRRELSRCHSLPIKTSDPPQSTILRCNSESSRSFSSRSANIVSQIKNQQDQCPMRTKQQANNTS